MSAVLWWILGFVLLIGEMVTGTFYLLILGATALLTGCIAWIGVIEEVQWLAAAIIASAGSFAVNRYRASRPERANRTQNLDVGQKVTLVDQDAGGLRVRYRGADWDAELEAGADAGALPEVLYIRAVRNNVLIVSPTP